MKITEIDLPTALQEQFGVKTGLKDVQLQRLGKHVVLAGPNGAGKSRLLRAILHINQQHRNNQNISNDNHVNFQRAVLSHRTQLLAYEQKPVGSFSQQEQANAARLRKECVDLENAITKAAYADRSFSAIRTVPPSQLGIVSYSVRSTLLSSAENMAPAEMRAQHEAMLQLGAEKASKSASAYSKQVLMSGFNASHQLREVSDKDATLVAASDALIAILKELLGESSAPTYEVEGFVSLFGQKEYDKHLSDGQKVLFQLGCAIHAQGTELRESVVFLDEPENHLHPAALVEVIDHLNTLTPEGQIWVATHSVPLIAHLAAKDPNCLWYMDNGTVEHAGKKPEKVLDGLMGGSDGAVNLLDFTLLPGQLAINRFLAECLNPPGVIGSNIKDPQTSGIAGLISKKKSLLGQSERFRVLDFGAGKGRLLASLNIHGESESKEPVPLVSEWLDYIAYDPDTKDSEFCLQEIFSVYGVDNIDRHYISKLSQAEVKFDSASFDLIVMCNVLHEVDPEDWLRLFGPQGTLTRLLKSSGGLLIVEDYQIPAGELAHRFGFLLLDELELKQLFGWTENDRTNNLVIRETSVESRYKDRLVMHWIGQPLLSNVSASSRQAAISQLKNTAGAKIKERQKSAATSGKEGHLYALAAQTYANASIWLDANPK